MLAEVGRANSTPLRNRNRGCRSVVPPEPSRDVPTRDALVSPFNGVLANQAACEVLQSSVTPTLEQSLCTRCTTAFSGTMTDWEVTIRADCPHCAAPSLSRSLRGLRHDRRNSSDRMLRKRSCGGRFVEISGRVSDLNDTVDRISCCLGCRINRLLLIWCNQLRDGRGQAQRIEGELFLCCTVLLSVDRLNAGHSNRYSRENLTHQLKPVHVVLLCALGAPCHRQ